MWPTEPILRAAWDRLVADPDTAGEFADLVYLPLIAELEHRFPTAEDGERGTAAGDAVLAFLKRPESYDPDRLPLRAFLAVIAERKLCTVLTAGGKHRAGRIPWDFVELDLPARNEEGDDDPLSFETPELRAVIDAFTPDERMVFDLLRTGERTTAAFALALGISDRPVPEQEDQVKRAKDRVKARLKRTVGGRHD